MANIEITALFWFASILSISPIAFWREMLDRFLPFAIAFVLEHCEHLRLSLICSDSGHTSTKRVPFTLRCASSKDAKAWERDQHRRDADAACNLFRPRQPDECGCQ
jgi:hypothetical protein